MPILHDPAAQDQHPKRVIRLTRPGRPVRYPGAASGPISEIIPLPEFTVAAASPSLTIETLHRSNMTFNLAAISGFNGPVTLACTQPYPVFLTCTAPTVTPPLNVPDGVAPGTYQIQVTATGQSRAR